MVEIMQETWAEMLVPMSDVECKSLPSPGSLRGKILIKVKRAASKTAEESSSSSTRNGQRTKIPSESDADDNDNEDEEGNVIQNAETIEGKKKNRIIEALSDLAIYTQSFHFHDLASPEAKVPAHVFSLSEKKLMDVHQSDGPTLFSHNRNYLMRAYPAATRLSSSNLDPAVFWRKGVQMVALNWQKWDAGMMLNEAMFGTTDGWVLKPEDYRGNGGTNNDISQESQAMTRHQILELTLEIFAAQDLPLPEGEQKPHKLHPYVQCELHVEKAEERSGAPIEGGGKSKDGEHKQRTKASKGIAPDFGGQRLCFSGITGVVEALSFVR